jgi:hypothetical protein
MTAAHFRYSLLNADTSVVPDTLIYPLPKLKSCYSRWQTETGASSTTLLRSSLNLSIHSQTCLWFVRYHDHSSVKFHSFYTFWSHREAMLRASRVVIATGKTLRTNKAKVRDSLCSLYAPSLTVLTTSVFRQAKYTFVSPLFLECNWQDHVMCVLGTTAWRFLALGIEDSASRCGG